MSTAIFQPMVALVFWTFVVLLLIPRARFKAARERRVTAADFAVGADTCSGASLASGSSQMHGP